MTNLNEIKFGLNQYCGPAVLSALTGRDTDECAEVISSINGKTVIKAVDVEHLVKAIEKLRFTVTKNHIQGYTLFGCLTHMSYQSDALYMILVPGHVVAVEVKEKKVYLVDNASKSPIDARNSARLTQKVIAIYKIIPKDPPKLLRVEIQMESIGLTMLKLYRVSVYEDEKDNIKVGLGSFSFRDMTELRDIMETIEEFYHDRTR